MYLTNRESVQPGSRDASTDHQGGLSAKYKGGHSSAIPRATGASFTSSTPVGDNLAGGSGRRGPYSTKARQRQKPNTSRASDRPDAPSALSNTKRRLSREFANKGTLDAGATALDCPTGHVGGSRALRVQQARVKTGHSPLRQIRPRERGSRVHLEFPS